MRNNKLNIDALKTKAMKFDMNKNLKIDLKVDSTVIESRPYMNILGVIIDENLNFDEHMSYLCRKVNFLLRRLYNVNMYMPLHIRTRIAHSILMSNIIYGMEIYSGTTSKNIILAKKLMNKVLRFVYALKRYEHTTIYMVKFLGCDFNNYMKYR